MAVPWPSNHETDRPYQSFSRLTANTGGARQAKGQSGAAGVQVAVAAGGLVVVGEEVARGLAVFGARVIL